MIDEAYEQGQLVALQEIEKVAGTEFAEKVAMKMPTWQGTKDAVGAAAKKVKDYHTDAYTQMKGGFQGKRINRDMGGKLYEGKLGGPMSKLERTKAVGAAGAKFLPAAGVAGGAGYGGYKAMSDDKKRK